MSFKTSTTAGKRRRFAQGSSSSRRLSSVVNPDVLHDVTFYASDEFIARQAPVRRHSVASLGFIPSLDVAPSPPKRTRAVSERIQISKADQDALLEGWDGGGGTPTRTPRGHGKLEVFEEEAVLSQDEHSAQQTATWMLVSGLFSGYVLSSAGLQQLNNLRPGCGQLVTLLQYLATIAEKAPHAQLYVNSPVLPMYWHFCFVFLMFISIKMGNASLAAGLPFGLFLVIKNTNLAWSLLLGLFATGRAFTTSQILSIAVVTAGISVCVLAQNQEETNDKSGAADGGSASGFLFAAFLCAASTFCMAALGSLQEVIFAQYKDGQEASESLFFTHLLGLPLFALGGGMGTMRDDLAHLAKTPTTSLSMLALNILFTLVVKQSFVQLLEEGESVTATLTLAVARMTGVVLSELAEGSSSLHFWLGALLVAAGSISYATGGRIPCKRA